MCEYLGYRTQPNYRIVCLSFSILLGKFVVKHISIYTEGTLKQEAHGPQFAHLSDSHCRHADVMQHFSNPIIATNENIII